MCVCVAQQQTGQQFFDEREQSHASHLLKGVLLEGSNQEQENFRYWFMLGQLGFFAHSSLASSPHAVVLVFNVMLRSLQKMISSAEREVDSPQLQTYASVVSQAHQNGLEVFIALTHLDMYEAERRTEAGSTDASERGDTRVGEGVRPEISELSTKLSHALDLKGAHVPPQNIFAVENYRVSLNTPDDRIELATLEFLDVLVDAADKFVVQHCPLKRGCVLS